MHIERGRLAGLLLLTPPRIFGDERGFFVETYRANVWSEAGLPVFVQDNHSRSSKGVLRGLHLNLSGGGQGKLVRASLGRIWDVAVDVRPSSPTFGLWQAFELSDENHRQLYIPPGFAHGFCTLSDTADVSYKLTSYYDDATELGIRWDDADLAVEWPVREPIVSKRDASAPSLAELRPKLPW